MKSLELKTFEDFSKNFFHELKSDESLSLSFISEETNFVRLTQSKIRQTTNLIQGSIECRFIRGHKAHNFTIPFKGNAEDLVIAKAKLEKAREWTNHIPDDPYLVRPAYYGVSKDETISSVYDANAMLEEVLESASEVDLAGVFASGDIVRANANNLGQFHWFKTRNFYLDYSLYNQKQKAVKSLYAGTVWNSTDLKTNLQSCIQQLELMNIDSKKIERGDYRVYLAPSAVSELLSMMSWGGLSMGAHKKGGGSFRDLWEGKKKLSPKFSLMEDFTLGLSPRFNDLGEVADMQLPLIVHGELKNFLTSTRTSNEFGVESNFAVDWEGMRSPEVSCGKLKRENILKELGTGLYISDLHYLNWSDRESARVTGMTRYACFWVENGELICPIQDLRFDESMYRILGDSLVDFTDFSLVVPHTGSYFQRMVGGSRVPGAMLSNFTFTL
jgi:predicted Zn-dependent protease